MDAVGIGASLFVTLISIVAVLCSMLLPLAIFALTGFLIYKRLKSGGAVVLQTNLPIDLNQAFQPATPKAGGSSRIKKVTCTTCGASKQVPPKTAYMYCDYCGALADWDFRISCQTAGSAKPGPAYEALQAKEGPIQAQAKIDNDRDAYRASLLRVFEGHMKHCPAAYSPRLGDPEYRAALLEFTVESYLAAAFDLECRERQSAMELAVKHLQWNRGLTTKVEPESFQRLVQTFRNHNERFLELCVPLLDGHPDHPTLDLCSAIGASAFIQGWLPYLDDAEQQRLIDEMGLGGQYAPIQPVETTKRHCGGCARPLDVVSGAKRVVCEACGHTNDVSQPELQCTGCGCPLSVPAGKSRFACPSCSAEMRLDGVVPG